MQNSHAERLLIADELCDTWAVELGSVDFNAGDFPSIMTLPEQAAVKGLSVRTKMDSDQGHKRSILHSSIFPFIQILLVDLTRQCPPYG